MEKDLKAVSIDPYKGYAMLEIQDKEGNTKSRMSVNKALRVLRASEDVLRIAQEEGFIKAPAVADSSDDNKETPELFADE